MILILEPGNAVSKGIFFRVKAPKRKYCNDVILAAIRQEPGIGSFSNDDGDGNENATKQ